MPGCARREGGLERDDPTRSGLGRGPAGYRGLEPGGHRIAEDIVGILLVGHPQGDPQVGVGAQVVLDDARRALRREDQVQPERAAALRDADDAVDELRHLPDERGELVDDDDQARWTVGVAGLLQGQQVLGVLGLQQALAAHELGPQAAQHAPHEVRVEVGDEPDAVRQPGAPGERRPAL